jgi:hypothetical protein
MTPFMPGGDATGVTVLIDAENVRRSRWPNLSREELVERARAWSVATRHGVLVVFDGLPPEEAPDLVGAASADDWLAEHAAEWEPYWLVTSDRELRRRAGGGADRVIGGGAFVQELLRDYG